MRKLKLVITLFAVLFQINSISSAFAHMVNSDALRSSIDASTVSVDLFANPEIPDVLSTVNTNAAVSVLSITPQLGAFNVDSIPIVKVTFANPININSVTNLSFILTGDVTGKHPGTFAFSNNNTVVQYKPNLPFQKGEKVNVVVSTKIKDVSNIAIVPFISQFTIKTDRMPGKFNSVRTYEVGERPICVVVNDLNGDGYGDIITANSSYQGTGLSNTISVLLNDQDGNYYPKTDFITDTVSQVQPFDISVGDVDGDGIGDVAVANFGSKSISILKNDGHGKLSYPKIIRMVGHPMKVKLFDVDADGDLDMVVTCGGINWYSEVASRSIYVFKNNGDGTFAAPAAYNVGYGQYGLDLFDLNKDGFADIVVIISKLNKVPVLFNNGDGTFGSPITYTIGVSSPQRVYIADLDGNGDGDIVITNLNSSSITVMKNNGKGVFSSRNYSTQGQPIGVYVSDVDGDGDQDIASANNNLGCNTISLWENRADGIFNKRDDIYVPPGKQPIDVFVANVDGDGDVDIVVANWTGNSVTVLKNSIPGFSGLVFNDINGNGVRDSLEFGLPDRLIVLEGNGLPPQYTKSDNNGEYFFVVTPGTYTIKLIPESGWKQTYPQSIYTVVALNNNRETKNIDFGSQYIVNNNHDIGVKIQGIQLPYSVGAYPELTAYCNGTCNQSVQNNFKIDYFNNGTEINEPCSLTVHLPAGEMYDAAQVNAMVCRPDIISGSIANGFVFEWYHLCEKQDGNVCQSIKQQTIQPKSLNIITQTACCTPTGTVLHASADILADDGNNNNHSEYDKIYTGPISPNVKLLVSPEGVGACQAVSNSDSLTYEIFFQNEGTAPINYVQVVDTLDALNLDISSLKMLLTSHPCNFNINGSGILTWTFSNLQLPTSTANLAGSIGYIKFRIKPRANNAGAVIKNRASISIENTAAIFTNYVTSTIAGDPTAIAKFEAVQPDFCGQPNTYKFNYTGNMPTGTFEWNFGDGATPATSSIMNPPTVTYNSVGAKVVSLKYTSPLGCVGTYVNTIQVKPSAVITGITASGPTTFCEGGSVTLTATAGNNYTWSTGATTQSITVNTSGKYEVFGCGGSHAYTVVTVNPLPIAEIISAQPLTICSGDSIKLNAAVKALKAYDVCIYDEAGGSCGFSADMCADAYTYTPGAKSSAPFTLLGMDSLVSIDFKIHWSCNYSNWTFKLNGKTIDSTENIFADNWECACNPKTGTNPSLFTIKSALLKKYWNVGGANTLTVVNNTPGFNMISGYSATINYLESSNAYTAAWSPTSGLSNSSIGNPFAKPTIKTEYILTVKDNNGCMAITQPKTVNVLASSPVEAGANIMVCKGQSVVLNASGSANYSWSNGVQQGVSFIPTKTATYRVTATNANGCSSVDSVTVTVNTLPIAEAGANQSVCSGNSVTLVASGGANYIWNQGVQQGVPFKPSNSGLYKATVTDANGCSSVDSLTVTVNTLPIAEAGANQIICLGNSITLTATGGANYSWNQGVQQGESFKPANSGLYKVTTTDGNGCSSVDSLTVTVNSLPIAEAGPNKEVCYGDSIILNATGGVSYTWDNGGIQGQAFADTLTRMYRVTVTDANGCLAKDSLTIVVDSLPVPNAGNNQTVSAGGSITLRASGGVSYAWDNGIVQGQVFTPTVTNTYTVTVTNAKGCIASDYVVVIVVPIQMIDITSTPTSENPCDMNNTIYIGYGHQTVTLTAVDNATSYLWSTGATTNSINVGPTVTTTYTVTTTHANGTSALGKFVLYVKDIRCGNKSVYICHLPPGNPNNLETICVAVSSVPAHLKNGSCLGKCQNDKSLNTTQNATENVSAVKNLTPNDSLVIFPNPNNGKFTIKFKAVNPDLPVEVIIYSIVGTELKLMKLNQQSGIYNIDINVSEMKNVFVDGVYLIRISNGNYTNYNAVTIVSE